MIGSVDGGECASPFEFDIIEARLSFFFPRRRHRKNGKSNDEEEEEEENGKSNDKENNISYSSRKHAFAPDGAGSPNVPPFSLVA